MVDFVTSVDCGGAFIGKEGFGTPSASELVSIITKGSFSSRNKNEVEVECKGRGVVFLFDSGDSTKLVENKL